MGRDIDQHLYEADVILLAVSSDFIASSYCFDREMAVALERMRRQEALVVPIILEACDWTVITHLSELQALPTNVRPVRSWETRSEAWTDVSRGLRKAIADWREIQDKGKPT